MPHVSRSIELAEPVGVVSERWAAFERTPRYGVGEASQRLRWRAEVLTFEPLERGTRLTLRIDYEPSPAADGLGAAIERALEAFRSFLAGGLEAMWHGGLVEQQAAGWKS